MDAETKRLALKRMKNLNYLLNETLDLSHRADGITPAVREEIQDCVEEWARILDIFKEEDIGEVEIDLFQPHIDAVTHFLYQMFDITSRNRWINNVSRVLSSLERFRLVFRTEQALVQAERISVFAGSGTTAKVVLEPVPPEFLKFAVFKDNRSAFTYYKKLVEMGEVATLQQLSEVMGVGLSATSMIMNKLVRDGWVGAEKDKMTNERIFRVKRRVELERPE
jgi:hypothetical protein